jgi:uncharacterized protein DUF4158
LLCLLKTFPILGRFPAPEDIPDPIVEYIANCAGLSGLTLATYPKRTRARHLVQIRRHLGIHRWGGAAESLAVQTIERIVGGRAHLSDLINGAIEALIAAHYELPALSTLRRLASGVHAQATAVDGAPNMSAFSVQKRTGSGTYVGVVASWRKCPQHRLPSAMTAERTKSSGSDLLRRPISFAPRCWHSSAPTYVPLPLSGDIHTTDGHYA